MKNKGIAGIAFWDHSENILPHQRQKDLEYKLEEFKNCLTACEFQIEAYFSKKDNKAWPKENLYDYRRFKDFIIKNKFLSIHARCLDCDISEYYYNEHRLWAVSETKGSIDFAFKIFADAITFHPGTYNSNMGKSWPDKHFVPELINKRSNALYSSLWDILRHFCFKAKEFRKKIYIYENDLKYKSITKELKDAFLIIANENKDKEYYHAFNLIINHIDNNNIPMDIIRYCKNPDFGIHLSIENVEPFNFLINTPKQHLNWYNTILDIYSKVSLEYNFDQFEYEYFKPKIIVDVNHYLNSQKILLEEQNYDIQKYFDGISDFESSFVKLPGEYFEDEPVLNKVVRTFKDDLLFFHIGGANFHDNYMTTHDPIKAIRKNMFMKKNFKDEIVAMYSFNNYKPENELNLEESLQIIGYEKPLILEVFNVSYGMILSSMLYTQEFIDHLFTEKKRVCHLMLNALDKIENKNINKESIKKQIQNSKFFFKSHKNEKINDVGYEKAGFYTFNDEHPFKHEIIATQKDDDGNIIFYV